MPDQRELFHDPEEGFRSAWAGIRSHMFTCLPAVISEDSQDGHTCKAQIAIKRTVEDATHNTISYEDFPLLVDVPIHHPGAGGITHTFAVKSSDEVLALFSSRSIDAWHQSGGVQQPIFDRLHSLSDAFSIHGVRSDPRKLQQVSTDSAQARDDAKHHVDDHHPVTGFKRKSVDPSTAAASPSFDPFAQATKFFEAILHPADGHAHNAVDGGTTHSITNTHTDGPKLSAKNGEHTVQAHPDNGVSIASTVAHLISAPNASLDQGGNLSVSGNSSAAGTVSGNSGSFANGISFGGGGSGGSGSSMTSTNLTGDVTGTFDASRVVSLTHVAGMQTLPQCASDSAAATAGVAVGGLYLSTAITIMTSSGTGGSGGSSSSTTIPAGLLRVRLA